MKYKAIILWKSLPPVVRVGFQFQAATLDHDDFRSVLMIHMAALAAADGRALGDAEALLEDALKRERRAWKEGL